MTSALSAGEKSYTTSEVGAEVGRTPCLKGGGQEELPQVRGQGQQLRVPGCNGEGTAKRSYSVPKARGGGREEQPHVQGAVAAWAQEGLEELSHIESVCIHIYIQKYIYSCLSEILLLSLMSQILSQ